MASEGELQKIVKHELGGRGYVVNLNARRQGEVVVGQVHITSAETDETVAKIVGAGNVEDLRMCFGVDAEGTMRDMIVKALGAWQGVQSMMPTFVIKTPKA
ncbi:MAG TPA: hypothetical protein VGR51_08340 [Thermoplasmata archaeon]|jgi:hypothetical protein|nr:hypothetical protein [Thermoplasmata archaeon]